MRHLKIPFYLMLVMIGCSANTDSQKTEYKFPQQSIITKVPESCASPLHQPVKEFGSLVDAFITDNFDVAFTPKEEAEFGKKLQSAISKEYKLAEDSDPDYQKIKAILNKILPHTSRKEIKYSVILIQDQKEVNAWTHSGGYIYITKALVQQVASEDELAFIIAHEVAHNENRHCDKALKRIKAASQLSGDPDLGNIMYAVFQSIFAAFDQHQEVESDLGAVYLTYKAGYDPALGQQFFERLAKKEDANDLGRMFRSHPYSEDRQACVQEYLEKARVR